MVSRHIAFLAFLLPLLSNFALAAPACFDKFQSALQDAGIQGSPKTIQQSSVEIEAQLESYYAQMNKISSDLLNSLNQALKDIDPPTSPPLGASQEMTDNYRSELRKYEQLRSGNAAYQAAQKSTKYIKLKSDADKLRKDTQFDDMTSFLVRFHRYNQVTIVGSDKSPAATAYIQDNRIVAYRINQGDQTGLMIFEPNSCETSRLMVAQTSGISTRYQYVNPKFCSSGAALKKLVDQLDDKKEEYEIICGYQGGSGAGCRCPNGKFINPWAESCYRERRLTAKDKLRDYIESTGANVWESKANVTSALEACAKYKVSRSSETRSTDNPAAQEGAR